MDGVNNSYIWKRRIAHGIRYQKGAVPFPESVKIGLEFNGALERKEELELSLLTNAVMLEISHFAKTVTKSEKYFLFEMLEFNFDLGVDTDNDKQYYTYALRVHNRIKLLKQHIKMKPRKWKDAFLLPDPHVLFKSAGPEASELYCPKWNKIADRSVLTNGSNNSQSETQMAETNGAVSSTYVIKKQGGVRLKLTGDAYPFCAQLGVTLAVCPNQARKQKLDPSLITNGVAMELLDFSRVLCGTHAQIVFDLVKLNFGYELDKSMFRIHLNKVTEKKYLCFTLKERDDFLSGPFIIQTEKKREYKRMRQNDADCQEQAMTSKRRAMLREGASDGNAKESWQDGDLSYMCPVDFETDMQSGVEARAENTKLGGCLSAKTNFEVKQEEEEVFVSPKDTSPHAYWAALSSGKKEETLKQKLWMRRAVRSQQILSSSRVNDMFAHCRDIGLDFDVGSGTRKNVDLKLFTNWVMWEVYKFATAMKRSIRSFLFDILSKNFNLVFQDETHERNFIFYMFTKEKLLLNHPDRENMEFLSGPLNFPEVYNMVDVTGSINSKQEVKTEDVDSSDLATSQQADQEKHPFCKKLGLNLWSTEERPNSQKLDLTALTTGAVLEMFSFVRELCGDVCDSVNDILEHNFDLNLHRGDTEEAQAIQRWYTTQKSLMKKQSMSQKINRWLNTPVSLNGHPQPPTGSSAQDADADDVKPGRHTEAFGEVVQQVETINSYHICKEIGLDLDVSAKSQAKAKLDLQVLTRGVMFEVHQYVERNCNRYVPALYEILDYNFDLSSQSHRKVEFAWSIASQVIAIAGKNGRKGDYMNKVFELPFEVSESSQTVCKEEADDDFGEPDLRDADDVMFVRKLKPVDIEVEID